MVRRQAPQAGVAHCRVPQPVPAGTASGRAVPASWGPSSGRRTSEPRPWPPGPGTCDPPRPTWGCTQLERDFRLPRHTHVASGIRPADPADLLPVPGEPRISPEQLYRPEDARWGSQRNPSRARPRWAPRKGRISWRAQWRPVHPARDGGLLYPQPVRAQAKQFQQSALARPVAQDRQGGAGTSCGLQEPGRLLDAPTDAPTSRAGAGYTRLPVCSLREPSLPPRGRPPFCPATAVRALGAAGPTGMAAAPLPSGRHLGGRHSGDPAPRELLSGANSGSRAPRD